MKRFFLGSLIMMVFSAAFSQKQYFIYLQSEPEQAFFVKINEKVHSSSSSGYLILSKLRDSSYGLSVGFPQNKWPEQKFTVDVRAKDHGYLLKNFGEKGWGLFDLQTMSIQMGLSAANNTSAKTEQKDVSAFTDILSKAANDPSLKEKPITPSQPVTKDDKKVAIEQPVIKKEDLPVVKKEDTAALTKQLPRLTKEEIKTVPVEEYKKSVVTKKSENSTPEGLNVTFVDDYGNGKKDTVRILIPNQKNNFAEVKEPLKEEKKFLDIAAIDTVKEKEPILSTPKTEKLPVAAAEKKNCPSVATDNDFLSLRKKMAAETSDDGMIDEAKKYFKRKCFTVSQIKNISALFLNDNGKYKFFDAAYTYTSDPDNFPSLGAELKDEYYINRFKAMLR